MMDEISRWYEDLSYEEAKNILREKMDVMKKNFIAAGYYMKYIRDNELFREDGYESIWEFAEDNYGIQKSTASRWMAMNDKFSQGGNSPNLADEFKEFEKSQLQEMLYLDDKQIEEVTPDMTVKEIREVRKPAEPVIVLKKPDEKDREYLDAAAKHLINCLYDWFLQDHMNRVLLVDRSPEEIKKKLGKDHRWRCFSTATGTAQINLFDDYVQLWDEKSECIGDFDWFYLAASIQSMWNEVALEKIKEEAVATSQQGDSDSDGLADMNPPAKVDDHADLHEDPAEEVEKVEAEVVEENELPADGKFEELSNKTDMDLLRDLLDREKGRLDLMREEFSENDIRVRKQKLIVGAYAGMIADLDVYAEQDREQPELPKLRNNDQRKAFLSNYREWPVWFRVNEASEVYYRYDLPDGSSIVICEYRYYLAWLEKHTGEDPNRTGTREYLLTPGYHYLEDCKTNTSFLIDYLKNIQKEAKENADRS